MNMTDEELYKIKVNKITQQVCLIVIMLNMLWTVWTLNRRLGLFEDDPPKVLDEKEFSYYDNLVLNGAQVKNAIKSFEDYDVAIVVQTEKLVNLEGEDVAINFGAILTSDGKPSSRNNVPTLSTYGSNANQSSAYLIRLAEEDTAILRKEDNYYYRQLHRTDGNITYRVDYYQDGYSNVNNIAYIDDKTSYSSTLIMESEGNIIGILFKLTREE